MTLVIAAQGDDFVVVATDSRGTIETPGGTRTEINFMVKLVPVSKYAVILMYGDANPANYLIERFRESLRAKNAGVEQVAEKFAKLCGQEAKRTKDVPKHPQYFPSLGFVIAGLVK